MRKKRPNYRGTKKKKPANQCLEFEIREMDSLGQGVNKNGHEVTFISKVLPGETGKASVYKKSKNVQFARVLQLDTHSEERIEPECPHFAQCSGCSYLHTSYENELALKTSALETLLASSRIQVDTFTIIPAKQRFAYRNRVQLHYRYQYLGLIDPVNDKVVEIPECKVINENVSRHVKMLYQEKMWDKGGKGHCEIYDYEGDVKLTWNEAYASEGFTQVNQGMNEVLKSFVLQRSQSRKVTSLLDLFSGTGNLSNDIVESLNCRRYMSDYSDFEHEDFHQMDLYGEDVARRLNRKIGKPGIDLLLLDPPRKGVPDLKSWLEIFNPHHIIYVSCNAQTLLRDLRSLQDTPYNIEEVAIIDMFPGTHHFETVAILAR